MQTLAAAEQLDSVGYAIYNPATHEIIAAGSAPLYDLSIICGTPTEETHGSMTQGGTYNNEIPATLRISLFNEELIPNGKIYDNTIAAFRESTRMLMFGKRKRRSRRSRKSRRSRRSRKSRRSRRSRRSRK